jgi:anti-sigma factor RsiW
MSMPLEDQKATGPIDEQLIDRLVDGELPNPARRDLLRRFETEPDGWRHCALAFLEAQTWRSSLDSISTSVQALPHSLPARDGPKHGSHPRVSVARLTALAAALAIAFAMGWESNAWQAENPAGRAKASVQTPESIANHQRPPETPITSGVQSVQSAQAPDTPTLLDPLIKKWEERGFRAEWQKRLISMELKDGRKIDVPIKEYELQYIGGRTY